MKARDIVRWIERGLFAVAVTLGLWCAKVLLDAHYVKTLPVPAPTGTRPSEFADINRKPPPTRVQPGGWLARLEAPSVHLAATVLEGSDDATLERAAGHIEDTALPGEPGNVGIAGHRDTTFRPVRHLKIGDALVVTTADHVLHYRITKTRIVKPEDVDVLDPTSHPTLTLVTCYPFEFIGHAPKRFIVSAELVDGESR